MLDDVSIYPLRIERQKVSTCLKVFCDETYNTLLIHPGMADFIKKIVTWWKIVNVKGLGADIRYNDPLGVIKNPQDTRL